jgi:hypothetical protein
MRSELLTRMHISIGYEPHTVLYMQTRMTSTHHHHVHMIDSFFHFCCSSFVLLSRCIHIEQAFWAIMYLVYVNIWFNSLETVGICRSKSNKPTWTHLLHIHLTINGFVYAVLIRYAVLTSRWLCRVRHSVDKVWFTMQVLTLVKALVVIESTSSRQPSWCRC